MMSVNAAFSIFKPNPLYKNLRDDSATTAHARGGGAGSHYDDVSSTSDHHDGKLSVLSEDIDDLDDGLRDVDDDLGLLTDQVRDLTAEKAELERRNAELEREKAELQRQKGAGDSELVDLLNELAAQKLKLEKLNRELESKYSELESRSRELEKQNAEWQATTSELETQNRDLQRQINEKNSEPEVDDEVVALVNELTSERDRLLKHNESLERQKDDLQRHYDELQQQPPLVDELAALVGGMETESNELKARNADLEKEIDEVYEVMEQMNEHVESLELHQHSLVAYVNKVCNDVKNVKRRGVWQKIEYDKERQLLVEELYQWKRRAEDLQATQDDAVAAAEAKAEWEAACLNQNIEQLQGEILTLQTELDETQEELSRRGGSAEEAAETEQLLVDLQELALDLKRQVDESNAALEQQQGVARTEIDALQEALRDLKQKAIKESVAHDRERQELVEELSMWKNRALEANWAAPETNQSEPDSATASSTSADDHDHDDAAHETDAGVAGLENLAVTAADAEEVADNQNEDPGDVVVGPADASVGATQAEEDTPASKTDTPPATDNVTPLEPTHGDNQKESELSSINDEQPLLDSGEKPANADNSGNHSEESGKPTTRSDVTDSLEHEGEDDADEVSLLAPPQHSDSFLGRLTRTFSLRSRTDSMTSSHGLEHESTTSSQPTRSRANSTASSTASTTSSAKRAVAKQAVAPPPPATQYTRNDFLRQQEPMRMNSFKHFL